MALNSQDLIQTTEQRLTALKKLSARARERLSNLLYAAQT